MAEQVVVGIDVSKAKLDVALLPSGEQFTVSNDQSGIARLEQRLRPLQPDRVVLEATGRGEAGCEDFLDSLLRMRISVTSCRVQALSPGSNRIWPLPWMTYL